MDKQEIQILPPLFEQGVQAGFPSPAEDFVESSLDLNTYLIDHPSATFFVRVKGQSMTGAGIFPEDLLIVDRAINPRDKTIVIAYINGDFTVKRLRKMDNQVYLCPENKNFKPIKISRNDDFQIWGVVAHVIHSFV